MSDKILLSVEDLINTAFGPSKDNRVNFKLVRSVFLILAHELRLLQHGVEIKFGDIIQHAHEKQAGYDDSYDDGSGTYSSSSAEWEKDERGADRGKKKAGIREKKDRAGKEDQGGAERGRKKDGIRERKDRAGKEDEGGAERGRKKDEIKERKDRAGKEDEGGAERGRKKDEIRERKDRAGKEDDGGAVRRTKKDEIRERKDRAGKEDDGGAERRIKKDEIRERKDQAGKEDDGGAERGRKKDKIRERKDRAEKEENGDRKDRGKKGDKTERGAKGEKEERKGRRDKGEREHGKSYSEDWEDKGRSKDEDSRSRDRRGRSRSGRGEHERDGERGADGRRGRGGEREDRDAQSQDSRGLQRRDFGRQTSGTSITVSEATRSGPGGRGSADKILVAERGPAARGRPARVGSIEVVTASQFALLGKAVKQLEQITGPQSAPVLPDDETLRQDLVKGRASLQETMQAVKLNDRVQTAEQDLHRLAELLTQLAQSGTLPPELAGHVGAMEDYLQDAIATGLAAAGPDGPGGVFAHFDKRMELDASKGYGPGSIGGTASPVSQMDAKKTMDSMTAEPAEARALATHIEMYEVMQQIKEELFKQLKNLTACANHSAGTAVKTSRNTAEKMDIAMNVNERIDILFRQIAQYEQLLGGFDIGTTTRVQDFQQHLEMMRNDLAQGFAQLDASNNNAETAALLKLTERHQGLVMELENTVHLHQNLHITQHQISDELRSLKKSVEILREQKASHHEVLDGLEYKANISCLAGLVLNEDFAQARCELERHLAQCYERFSIKDQKWQNELKALMDIANNKGDMLMLQALKELADVKLNDIKKLMLKLEIMLGEPKAAIQIRKLAKDATCAACKTSALMNSEDSTYGKPLPLPSLRPPPLGAEQEPSLGPVKLAPPDIGAHLSHRWAGGSHTLVTGNIVKEQAKNMQLQIKPTKKLEGYGADGRLYMMEEDMQPCVECNKLCTDEPGREPPQPSTPTGAGDQASAPPVL